MRSLIQSGGLRSLESLRPSIPSKAWSRPPPFILPLLRNTPTKNRRPSRLKVPIRSEPKSCCFRVYRFSNLLSWIPWSSHQVIASNLLWYRRLGVKGRVPVFCLAQKQSVIGERRCRGKAVQLLSLSRLPRRDSVPRGLDRLVPILFSSWRYSQPSSPILRGNPFVCFFSFSLPFLSLF